MNQRTVKLLRNFSSKSDKNISELKLWWSSIPRNKRHNERLKIIKELKS